MRRLLIALTALVARCEEPQAPAAPPAPISLTIKDVGTLRVAVGKLVKAAGPQWRVALLLGAVAAQRGAGAALARGDDALATDLRLQALA